MSWESKAYKSGEKMFRDEPPYPAPPYMGETISSLLGTYPFPPYVMMECRTKRPDKTVWIGLVDKKNHYDLDCVIKTEAELFDPRTRATDVMRQWVHDYWKTLKECNVY